MPKYSKRVELEGRTAQELYDRVSQGIDRFLSKTPLKGYKIDRDPDRKIVSLDSSMAQLTLNCEEGVLELDGKLSLMAMPFKSNLDAGIDRWLEKEFQS